MERVRLVLSFPILFLVKKTPRVHVQPFFVFFVRRRGCSHLLFALSFFSSSSFRVSLVHTHTRARVERGEVILGALSSSSSSSSSPPPVPPLPPPVWCEKRVK